MSLNWKKILMLVGFLAIVILIGYLLYFLFLKPIIPTPPPGTNINVDGTGLPPAGTNVNIPIGLDSGLLPSGINTNIPGPPRPIIEPSPAASLIASGGLTVAKPLTTVRSYSSTLGNDGSSILFYDKNSGQFYRLMPDGRQVPLTDKIFHQVEQVTWSSNKEQAVLEYPDGSNIVYDFKNKRQFTLPQHWKDFSFSPDNDQLVFKSMGSNTDNTWLAVANSDGSEAIKIEPLGDKDATVYPLWSPNKQIIAMFSEGKNFDQQYLYFLGLNNENFKSSTIEGRNFEGIWSPKGDRLFYSVYSSQNDFKPSVWIVSAQGENIGQNRKNLGLKTWADKCTFTDNDTIYCAVPQSLEEGAGIFRDDFDTSPTDIYKIDLKTGLRSRIATPEGAHNMESLIVSGNGQYLYFVSKDDGRIYQVQLR